MKKNVARIRIEQLARRRGRNVSKAGIVQLRGQLTNLRRNSCSSILYLNALCPSMNTTGTWSLNSRRNSASVSTSTSRQMKPPLLDNFERLSFTTSQRWHPLREYTTTLRNSGMREHDSSAAESRFSTRKEGSGAKTLFLRRHRGRIPHARRKTFIG